MIAEMPAFISKARKGLYRHLKGVHQSVSVSAIDTRHECSSSSDTFWIAERAVRRVEEQTATAMIQSGLPDHWWDRATKCYHYARTVHHKMADGKIAYEKNVAHNPMELGSCSEPCSERQGMYASIWQWMRPAIFNRREDRREFVRWLAHRRLRRSREPDSPRYPRQTVEAPGSRTRWKAVVSMCRLIFQTLRSSSTLRITKCRQEKP